METGIPYQPYREQLFTTRFVAHALLKQKISDIKAQGLFTVEQLGHSVQGRAIYHLSIGTGKITILLWSQMHGDESSGTLCFFDVFNFLASDDEHNTLRDDILQSCTLHFVPMLNPDGAAVHQRRNAQGIDMNRDFLKRQTPEANLLIDLHAKLNPEFCFNMHDQETLWSVSGSKKPASISLLAPPVDGMATVTPCRHKAMLVIAGIHVALQNIIPNQIGRWSDEFEPRAFGDNFQKLGSATILVEGGGFDQDFERQYVRELHFGILLNAFAQIASKQYMQQQLDNYYSIPLNSKELFHLLIKNCSVETTDSKFITDIGLNYSETIDPAKGNCTKTYIIADIGDLSTWNAYEILDANSGMIHHPININTLAHFKIDGVIKFKNGVLIG